MPLGLVGWGPEELLLLWSEVRLDCTTGFSLRGSRDKFEGEVSVAISLRLISVRNRQKARYCTGPWERRVSRGGMFAGEEARRRDSLWVGSGLFYSHIMVPNPHGGFHPLVAVRGAD